MSHLIPDEKLLAFGACVRLSMAKKRWTRKKLSNKSKISDGVITKVLAKEPKPIKDDNVITLAKHLEIDLAQFAPSDLQPTLSDLQPALSDPQPAPSGPQPRHNGPLVTTGFYTRDSVREYEGVYFTFRPSLDGRQCIRSFLTKIMWNEEISCLEFQELNRPDSQHSHCGRVFIPSSTSFLYLVSGENGWVRTVTLWSFTIKKELRGSITTLYNSSGPMLIPTVAPIVYRHSEKTPLPDLPATLDLDDPRATELRIALRETMADYVRFVGQGF